jgi:hypothetical protein
VTSAFAVTSTGVDIAQLLHLHLTDRAAGLEQLRKALSA